ncbi:hypothetical protein LTR10_007619 [Elasticomyces elasticus]|nr:hypothetical protein LTR10_007619 [Elasticomyces elasticus]
MAQVSTTTVIQPVTSGAKINDQQFQGWYFHSDSSSFMARPHALPSSRLVTEARRSVPSQALGKTIDGGSDDVETLT